MSDHAPDQEDEGAVRALTSPDARVRLAALERLVARHQPISAPLALAVVECLGAGSKALQRRAADALRCTSESARPIVLAALRRAAASADRDRRWGAAYTLGQLDVLEPVLVPALLEALQDRDGDRRWAAAELLVRCGMPHSTEVVSAVRDVLRATIPEGRKMALYVLRGLEIDAPEVTREMLGATHDGDAAVRLAALAALTGLREPPPDACEEALRLVREDPSPGVRRAAVSALGKLGRGVVAAAEAISAALDSADPSLRRAAQTAKRLLSD